MMNNVNRTSQSVSRYKLLTSNEFTLIENKILTDLQPLSSLLQKVPTKPVPSYLDTVKRIKYSLKNSGRKTAKTALPDLGELEKTEITIPLETYKSPIIEIDIDTIVAAKATKFPVQNAINTGVLYDLIEQENKAVLDVLGKSQITDIWDWSGETIIADKVNNIFKSLNLMRKNKVPLASPKLIMNPEDIGNLGFNDYLNGGLDVVQNKLKVDIIPSAEIPTGSAILYDASPVVMEFPIAKPAQVVQVNANTAPPLKYAWFVQEKFGGAILNEAGVVKITIESKEQ